MISTEFLENLREFARRLGDSNDGSMIRLGDRLIEEIDKIEGENDDN